MMWNMSMFADNLQLGAGPGTDHATRQHIEVPVVPCRAQVTLEEFTDGILKCKGPARAVDQARGLKLFGADMSETRFAR